MNWTSTLEKLPDKSGLYEVIYTYLDKGKEEEKSFLSCYYDNAIKMFDIEGDNLPHCKVIKWNTKQ